MQEPGSERVGGLGEQIYTPYTKYLSDRKYFDVNVCEKAPESNEKQRRNSGTTISSCAYKSKLPMAIPKTSTVTNNANFINKIILSA